VRIIIIVGSIQGNTRLTRSAVFVRSSFATAKTLRFGIVAHESSDDAHPGDLLAQHLVDAVDLQLHGPELGMTRTMTTDEDSHHRHRDQEQRRELRTLVNRE